MDMEGGSAVPDDYEIAVDYMDMTNDRHLWARAARREVAVSRTTW